MNDKKKTNWREAAIWALIVALVLEFAINLFARRTVWHRISAIEHRLERIEDQLSREGR
jgi:hypothetical protein